MNLDRLAIVPSPRSLRDLPQRIHAQAGDAANALARGFRLDLRGSSLGDNRALIDYGNAVGQRIGFLQIVRR